MDAGEIAEFIREVRPVIYGGRVIDAEQMKVYIDKMNEIINHEIYKIYPVRHAGECFS